MISTQRTLSYVALMLLLMCPWCIVSQQTTSSVRGTVLDVQGAAVAGATVEVTDRAAGVHQSVTTNDQGEYQFPQLVPGDYSIRVSYTGFGKQEKLVRLLVAQPATVNFALNIADSSTTVTVTSTDAALNTTDATIGNAVDNATVQALPMEGRNVPDLLSLQPGVLYLGRNSNVAYQDEDSRSGVVSGARSDQGNVTLDGLDNNDQVTGLAFNGVLRSTLDSVEEFRVTTTGNNAESGRSSGAQVNVVTKSGTNQFHASLYEYNRDTSFAANDWFNKQSQFKQHLPNRAGKLIRNTFGAAAGGPIKKDKIFYFGNFESQRTAENLQVTNTVPSAAYREGILQYTTAVAPAAGNNVVSQVNTGTYLAQLTPAQFAVIDPNCTSSCPWGHGEDPNVLALAKEFPLPNATGGDGYNTSGFTWSAPNPVTLNTAVAKFDYVLNDKHRLFLRGNLQDDKRLQPPAYPTSGPPGEFATVPQLPSDTFSDGTKGFAVGETWLISSSLINNVRFGYTHQSYSDQGPAKQAYTTPSVVGLPFSTNRTQIISVPVYNIVDDTTWTHKSHNFQFGINYRLVKDSLATDSASYSSATASSGENFDAISNTGQSLDPASPEGKAAGYAPVLSSFGSSYSSLAMGTAGVVASESIAYQYHYNGDGTSSLLPDGALVQRHFKANEFEYYFQDQWRVTPKLTITYGIRHTILQTPYEVNGQQVQPSISLHDFFNTRVYQASKGVVDQPNFSFSPSGKANNGKPFFPMSWKNFSPRIGVAYALNAKTSIRSGFGLYFDHFGEGVVRNFSELGSYGLGGKESTPAGFFSPDTAPRFTSITDLPVYSPSILPPSLLPPPPTTLTYPYSPPSSGQAFAWALDDKLQTPYSFTMNLDVQRELPKGFVLETAYVGRLGRHLLVQRDLGMPLDLVDPATGMDYFTAASLLEVQAYAKVPTANVQKIAYWEDLFPDAAGANGSPNASIPCPKTVCQSGNSATQNIYNQYAAQPLNATDDLNLMDTLCSPGCGGQLYRYYNGAFSSLYADSTIGTSSYHSGQIILRHPMSHGLQEDFSYTFSRAIDIGSDTERTCTSCRSIGTTAQSSTGVLINSFNPRLNRSVADFDTTHIITSDVVYKLPFGRGGMFLKSPGRFFDAVLSGWQLNGLGRWTSGLPFGLQISGGWMTAWPKQSMTIETKPLGKLAPKKSRVNGVPNAFPNPTALVAGITGLADNPSPLRYPLPGEVGERNKYRGDGYFDIDSGLMKTWSITERQTIKFDWEVFNVTNSVRFDTNPVTSLKNSVGQGNLGAYTATLSVPRVQQMSLRYDF
ncbi:MAG TPA: carboxypeptidase-like regulatory domain-containing protein [Acidobacteriaceae bacterium]|nr:carboxypeptidase-like regulatory domain-containing protein [Acidobacteriaceae bacterium]